MMLLQSLLHFDPVNAFNTHGLWSLIALVSAASQRCHIHMKSVLNHSEAPGIVLHQLSIHL